MDNVETVQKEESKLEVVESSLEHTSSMITSIFQKVSNIEEKIGVNNQCDSKGKIKEEALLRFEKISDRIKIHNDNLSEISIRLQKMLELF